MSIEESQRMVDDPARVALCHGRDRVTPDRRQVRSTPVNLAAQGQQVAFTMRSLVHRRRIRRDADVECAALLQRRHVDRQLGVWLMVGSHVG
jgi:ribosomal protein L16/L10AE